MLGEIHIDSEEVLDIIQSISNAVDEIQTNTQQQINITNGNRELRIKS